MAVRVEGVREVTRALAKVDKDLAREIGRRNKEIGQRVIARVFPKPASVGAGAGATPRAQASRNMVAIVAGGPHRQRPPVQQWGRRHVAREGPRPFILGTIQREFPNIEREYLDAIEDAIRAFAR